MQQAPQDALRAYVRAFETLDLHQVLPFYSFPCTFITPAGVTVVSDATAARGLAEALIEQARSQGYRRTEMLDLAVKLLGAELALLSGVFVRYDAQEQEIGRFGFAYTLRRDDTGWRIIVALSHDVPG